MEYEVVVVARPGLVPQRLTRKSLESTTWISREAGSATRTASDRACPSESARAAILRGGRIRAETWLRGFRHQPVCRCSRVRRKSLVALPIRGWDVYQTVSLLRVREAVSIPAADQFQTFVRRWFGEAVRHHEFERAELKVSAARMSGYAAFGHKKPQHDITRITVRPVAEPRGGRAGHIHSRDTASLRKDE